MLKARLEVRNKMGNLFNKSINFLLQSPHVPSSVHSACKPNRSTCNCSTCSLLAKSVSHLCCASVLLMVHRQIILSPLFTKIATCFFDANRSQKKKAASVLFWLHYVRWFVLKKGCCDVKTLFNSWLWRAMTAFIKISTKWDSCNPFQSSFLHRIYRNLHSLLLGANVIILPVAPSLTCSLNLAGYYDNSQLHSLSNQLCIILGILSSSKIPLLLCLQECAGPCHVARLQ